jgi:hypothetical protein
MGRMFPLVWPWCELPNQCLSNRVHPFPVVADRLTMVVSLLVYDVVPGSTRHTLRLWLWVISCHDGTEVTVFAQWQ